MSLEYKHGLIEREEAERRFIEGYRQGLISKNELVNKYPKYKPIIEDNDEKLAKFLQKQEKIMDNFRKEIDDTIKQKIEEKIKYNASAEAPLKNKILIKAMELIISHQSALLDIPFLNLLPAGYIVTKIIPIDEFSKKFKLSKPVKLALHLSLILTLTNYFYAFQSSITVSKESIPNLIVIATSLGTNLFNTISKGGLLQLNNVKGLGTVSKAMLGGKLLKEFQKLSTNMLGGALALGLVQNSITNYDTDIKEIINSVDDDSGFINIVKSTFKTITGKINEPKNIEDQVFKSPTFLYTNEELKKINNNILKFEPIIQDLTTLNEVSSYNPSHWSKAIGLVKSIPTSLEDIKSQQLGTRVEDIIKDVLYSTDPQISKHVNMDTLNITAKAINNEIETTCNLLESEGRYALYKGVEQYNFQTSLGGLIDLPGIKLGEIRPVNAFEKVQEFNVDIVLGTLGLIFMFSLLYHLYSGFKKVYRYFKKDEDNVNLEVMPDQRIRYNKRKSKSNSKRR